MTATIIPFPQPTPNKTVESQCPACGVIDARVIDDCVGMPIATCACGASWFELSGFLDDIKDTG